MALTMAQKNELTKSGVLKNYVGKSWDDPDVQKTINEYYNPTKKSSSSSSSNSSGKSSTKDTYPVSGSVWVTRPDGSQTAANARDLQKLLEKGYTYDGVRTSGTGGITKSSRDNDNDNNTSDMYDEQMKALRAQIKAGIAKAKGQYTNIINQAPQTYQPLRNQVSLGKEQQLQSLRESLANQGNRGGTGRQAMLNTETAAGNQMNDINLQQQNTINDANRGIADVEQQGKYQESQLTAELAAQKLRDIMAQEQRAGEMAEDTRRWEADFGLQQQELEDSKAAERLRNELASIGAYSNDYMAEIQRRQGTESKEDDAIIPYLTAARNEKIAAQLAQADNTANQAYKNAYELWKQLGVATEDIARILNIPVGSMTLDKIKADYSTAKPYYAPKTSSTSSSSGGEEPWYLQ
jgi:hypothetical protein